MVVMPLEVTKVWQSNDYGATWTIPQTTPETSHQAYELCPMVVLPLEVTKVWQTNGHGATRTISQITPETSHQASILCLNGSYASGGNQSVVK